MENVAGEEMGQSRFHLRALRMLWQPHECLLQTKEESMSHATGGHIVLLCSWLMDQHDFAALER